jgi:prepilin-type N-terminal cleavage/methylation domain-containing protein
MKTEFTQRHSQSQWFERPLARGDGEKRWLCGKAQAAFTLIELLVVIGIVGLLVSLLLPALSRAKSSARGTFCVNSLRQLGAAVRMYSDENNSLLPAAELLPSTPVNPARPLARICDVLAPHLGRADAGTNSPIVFKCPSDQLKRFELEGSSYQWNTRLNGHRMDEVQEAGVHLLGPGPGQAGGDSPSTNLVLRFPPVNTPLLLDYDAVHPHSGVPRKNSVYMDGHVAKLGS